MKTFLLALILVTSSSLAQSISPVTINAGKHASGDVTLTNNYLTPITTTIEPHSFHFEDGKPVVSDGLDEGVSVRLNHSSARIAPKEAHEFGYKVACAHLPCAVTFVASSIVGKTPEGLALAVIMNSTVYVCQKERDCRKNILLAGGVKLGGIK